MSIYNTIDNSPLPATRFAWQLAEVHQLRKDLKTQTTERDGVLFWNSNGAPVPLHVFEETGVPASVAQAAAVRRYTDAALADYRANPPRLSADNLAEALNELGPNSINVITGRRLR